MAFTQAILGLSEKVLLFVSSKLDNLNKYERCKFFFVYFKGVKMKETMFSSRKSLLYVANRPFQKLV